MKNYITVDGKKSINLPEEYKDMHDVVRGTISWQVWEKGNKKRVYGKVYCGGKVIEVGYVDLVSCQMVLSSNPRAIAKSLSYDIEIVEIPEEPEEMEEMEESPIEEPKKDVEGNVFNYGRKEVLLVAWGYFRRHYFSTFAESLRVAWGEFKAGKKCFLIELRDRIKAKRKPIVEKMVDSGINAFKNLPGSYKMRIDYSADWFAPKYQALFNIL